MAATKKDIDGWIKEGKKAKATHLIVVCDTFDWEDYPIFVKGKEELLKVYNSHNNVNMQRVMEVFDIKTTYGVNMQQIMAESAKTTKKKNKKTSKIRFRVGDFVKKDDDCCGTVIDISGEWIFFKRNGEVYCYLPCELEKIDFVPKAKKPKIVKRIKVGDLVIGDSAVGIVTKIIENQWVMVKDETDGREYPEMYNLVNSLGPKK